MSISLVSDFMHPLWRYSLPPHIHTEEDFLALSRSLSALPHLTPIQIDHCHDSYLLGLFDGSRSFSPHLQSRFGYDSDGSLLYTLYCLGYSRGSANGYSSLYPGVNILSLFGLDYTQSICKQHAPIENKLDKLDKQLDKLSERSSNKDKKEETDSSETAA